MSSSRNCHDSLDATSHVSSNRKAIRRKPIVVRRTQSLVPTSSSSSSICEQSPQPKLKNKIQWTRRTPPHSSGRSIRDLKSLSSPPFQPHSPRNLGEILDLVGTRQQRTGGSDSHLYSPYQHNQGSSRSVVSAGSRVSFAKELVEVVDIPEYDNESRNKCFYSNRDLSEFRCEWEMEQDGLMPMQR
jgi:hypothetical protein